MRPRGRGRGRGRGQGTRANLPSNREGVVDSYTKEGKEKVDLRPKFDLKTGPARKAVAPTVEQIQADNLTELAKQYWAPHSAQKHKPFDPKVIEMVYTDDLKKTEFTIKRIMMLEFSQFLENYLWPNLNEDSTREHVLSIVLIFNEKFRERVPAWPCVYKRPEHFKHFFRRVLDISLEKNDDNLNVREQTFVLLFLDHCFNSMEIGLVRDEVQKLMSLSMWMSLMPARRDAELKKNPKWRKYWKAISKSDAKDDEASKAEKDFSRQYMRRLMDKYFEVLHSIDTKVDVDIANEVEFCEYFLMLMIDLEALLPTRRFFDTVLDDAKIVVVSAVSTLATKLGDMEGRLFIKLLGQLKFYTRFEISNSTGEELSRQETTMMHYDRITALQRAVFTKYPEMRKFALDTVASVDDPRSLEKYFSTVSTDVLRSIAEFLALYPEREEGATEAVDMEDSEREVLLRTLIFRHEKRISQLQELNEMPLYPTEKIIWDEDVVPGEFYNGETVLALPKLNLQFLTLNDYLLRNFKLFQLESTYEIRGDVEDAVARLKPWCPDDGEITFNGWARMAQPITAFSVVEVAKPNIGESQPSRVRADVSINLSVKQEVKGGTRISVIHCLIRMSC